MGWHYSSSSEGPLEQTFDGRSLRWRMNWWPSWHQTCLALTFTTQEINSKKRGSFRTHVQILTRFLWPYGQELIVGECWRMDHELIPKDITYSSCLGHPPRDYNFLFLDNRRLKTCSSGYGMVLRKMSVMSRAPFFSLWGARIKTWHYLPAV